MLESIKMYKVIEFILRYVFCHIYGVILDDTIPCFDVVELVVKLL